jgi:hypothetical protein
VEQGVARQLVAQEQLIRQLNLELQAANAAQEYLDSVNKRISDDNAMLIQRSVHTYEDIYILHTFSFSWSHDITHTHLN